MTNEPTPPIVCDMTSARDTPAERLAEYQQLFATALIDRERTDTGIRFRFRNDPGTADHIRDLAAREKACCAFFDFEVTETVADVRWDASVVDDPIARLMLDELYLLPDRVPDGVAALHQRYAENGLLVVVDDDGISRAATHDELGIAPPGP